MRNGEGGPGAHIADVPPVVVGLAASGRVWELPDKIDGWCCSG